MILASSQEIPFETIQAKIFTKVRHSQTIGEAKTHEEDTVKTKDCTITRS